MANLSNIDNKFLVTTGGNIGIGDTGPTRSLSILRSEAVVNIKSSGVSGHSMIILDHASSANNYSQVRFSNAGSAKFAIGIDPQDSYKLKIVNDGNATGANTRMTITTGGDVGIGTSTPLALLDISSGTTTDVIRFGADSRWGFSRANSDNRYLSFMRNQNGSGTAVWTVDGDNGNFGIGTTTPSANLEVAGDVLINSGEYISWGGVGETSIEGSTASTKIQFRTGSGDRMIINNTGVGIGTTSPDSKLEVVAPTTKTNLGTVSNQTITCSGGGGVGEYNQIGFGYTAGDYSPGVIGYVTTNGAVSTLGALIFALRDSTTAIAPTERMRITSGGLVGIGTTSPSSYNSRGRNLVVAGSGDVGITIDGASSSSGTILFADGTGGTAGYRGIIEYDHADDSMAVSTAATERIIIDNGGNIGMGISPTEKLDVFKDSGSTYIRVYDSSANSEVGLKLQGDAKTWTLQNWGSGGDMLRVLNNAGTTIQLWDEDGSVGIGTTDPGNFDGMGLPLVVGDGSGNSGITIFCGANAGDYASILFADASTGTGRYKGKISYEQNNEKMSFWTNETQRMLIDINGNVGIGTDSPQIKLQITGNSTNSFLLDPINSSIGQNIFYNGSAWDSVNHSVAGSVMQLGTDGSFAFRRATAADPPVLSYSMYIDSNGKVGIGTTSPAQELDVAGRVTHDGLVLKSGTGLYVDTITTFNITLDFVAGNWVDSGLTSLNNSGLTLGASGTYAMQIYSDDHSGEPLWYSMYWSGIMSWYDSNTNQLNTQNPIVLQKAGHGDNGRTLEAQILWQTAAGTPANAGLLQLKCNATTSSTALRLRFRRLL